MQRINASNWQGFLYSNYYNLRNLRLRGMIAKLMVEILFVLSVSCVNIYISTIDVETKFSQNEKNWSTQSMTEITMLYSALIIFKIFTIGLSQADLEFRIKTTIFVIFQLIMYIRMSILYFEGL